MAEYVVVDKEQLEADITTVADAIREKGGTSEQLPFPNGMADAVRGIQSGGGREWKETEITSSISNADALIRAIVGGSFKENAMYCAVLTNVEEADYVYNQVPIIMVYQQGSTLFGQCLRYRNGALTQISITIAYDAYAEIGTIYKWFEMEV